MKTNQIIIKALIQDHCELVLEPLGLSHLFDPDVIILSTANFEIDLVWKDGGLLETQVWCTVVAPQLQKELTTRNFDANNSTFISELTSYLLEICEDSKVKMSYVDA